MASYTSAYKELELDGACEDLEKKLAKTQESLEKYEYSLQESTKKYEDLMAKNSVEKKYRKVMTERDNRTLEAVKLRVQGATLTNALEFREAQIKKLEERKKIIKRHERSNNKKLVDAYVEGFNHGMTG